MNTPVPNPARFDVLTEEEERELIKRQVRNARIFGALLGLAVILLIIGTIVGLVRLGFMPYDQQDLFRSH